MTLKLIVLERLIDAYFLVAAPTKTVTNASGVPREKIRYTSAACDTVGWGSANSDKANSEGRVSAISQAADVTGNDGERLQKRCGVAVATHVASIFATPDSSVESSGR